MIRTLVLLLAVTICLPACQDDGAQPLWPAEPPPIEAFAGRWRGGSLQIDGSHSDDVVLTLACADGTLTGEVIEQSTRTERAPLGDVAFDGGMLEFGYGNAFEDESIGQGGHVSLKLDVDGRLLGTWYFLGNCIGSNVVLERAGP